MTECYKPLFIYYVPESILCDLYPNIISVESYDKAPSKKPLSGYLDKLRMGRLNDIHTVTQWWIMETEHR